MNVKNRGGLGSLLQMRGGRYAAMDFCKGEGVTEGEGRKYSPSSMLTEKCCEHSKESCQARPKGVYSPLSQQGFCMHNLSKIEEWIPLCFHSKESAPGQCAGIFRLKRGKQLEPWKCVRGTRQFPLRLAATAVTGTLCMSAHICIFEELPVLTKI